MTNQPRVEAYLRIAGEELGASRAIARSFPRQAAYLAQQAVEKIARAVLASEGIPFGPSHNIGQMAAALPPGHAWRPKIASFDRLSPAATSCRYPAPGGRIAASPSPPELEADIARIEKLLGEAQDAFAR